MPGTKPLPAPRRLAPRLIVVPHEGEAMAEYHPGATAGHPFEAMLGPERATLRRMVPASSGQLNRFFRVIAAPERLEEISGKLREHDSVAAAFLKPAPDPPLSIAVPTTADPAPAATPDFIMRQGYLDAAPGGIDARFAWNYRGGGGKDIQIIDIEGAWQLTHEDLAADRNGLAGGNPSDDVHWRNHGTAVLGVISGGRNGFGVTGICPEASVRTISIFGDQTDSAAAIHHAAELLSPGDIILVELHQPGPRFQFGSPSGQDGFIAVEWWPDDFAAIQYATSKGILVVEAAGNGAENLDDALYDRSPDPPYGPFPASWRNPFRRGASDSGAILVGAGAPPPGTHGKDNGPDRSRLAFSNYGAAVDAQGWGMEVTTCGYGSLQGGDSEDLWYTDAFNGTSSASPIVVGALGCVQGALRAANQSQLAPAGARELLRNMGSPQGAGGTERIGNRPDLRQILLARIGALA